MASSRAIPYDHIRKSMEKMARLHFYFHTIQSGENQTTMRIAGPAKTMVALSGLSWWMIH
ncbi:hypothetical protein NC651_009555 [Populus alba x Populus x berolinensis]|uniref:Uncharacterized protein n=1 Tax=Populus alba x Populus x berolinensis TaxID=444605 RepID=A0AAD6RAD4_9ROSI|nr:hypothetical protein NC651_009555 [Populus alba x Populus x berolinensis]KAJ7005103.1 hypothetical protein NC653_009812 [Populus alba x Populus x berolinensis]